MGALAVAFAVVVTVIVVSLIAFVALRSRSAEALHQVQSRVHPRAPSYRAQAEHAEYYRPSGAREGEKGPPLAPGAADPRKKPLPRCPLCDAAIGFDDARCPKCGHDLKDR